MVHSSWKPLFDEYDFDLDDIYDGEVYPPKEQVFRVFDLPVQDIQIVLLGQDPYHGPGQAHGLSFSVPNGIPTPPSLQNIFKELQKSFPARNYKFPSGNLEEWLTREKIFLCNTSLTVEKGKPGSHMSLWKEFTDEVIQYIDTHNKNCVFLLLGNFAKGKASLITKKDRIVTEVHPSPLAQGFVGSGVFQRVEKVLGREVNWSIEKVTGKRTIYIGCDPAVFGTDKLPVTLGEDCKPAQAPVKEKKKMSKLERMCEDPQTPGEETVKIYVEYCKLNNIPITVEDINACLS